MSFKETAASYVKACIFTIAVIAILEVSFRIYDTATNQLFLSQMSGDMFDRILTEQYRLKGSGKNHPYLGYTSSINFESRISHLEPNKTFLVKTNAHGFRTHEFYPKHPGQVRIVLMGDSFVWGHNANQDETLAAVMERLFKERTSKDVEVLSLGVNSYSGVSYAVLSRLYLDFLKPDIVIVALDQSDFGEDIERIKEYVLEDGYPLILASAKDGAGTGKRKGMVMDMQGRFVSLVTGLDLGTRLRMSSSLLNRMYLLKEKYMGDVSILSLGESETEENDGGATAKVRPAFDGKVTRYEDLVEEHGEDLSGALGYLQGNTILINLNKALERYKATYKSLEYIRNETGKRGISLYLSSYPYPWMITPFESVNYHLDIHKSDTLYDFSANRVHPRLVDAYAADLGVPHLNAYPVFEKDPVGMWGNRDPHFSKKGYGKYAEFLFNSVRKEVEGIVSSTLPNE